MQSHPISRNGKHKWRWSFRFISAEIWSDAEFPKSSARAEAGPHSIIVLDSVANQIAAWIPNVDLVNGMLYDVIAFQELNSDLVHAYAVPYPTNALADQ